LRNDYEAGKGDHRHVDIEETRYVLISVDPLLEDCFADAAEWKGD